MSGEKLKKTYIIGGHGREPFNASDTFIVPENCIVIAKMYSGEQADHTKIFNPLVEKFLNKELLKSYKDPLNNLETIFSQENGFGSVSIYKAGDMCPNFVYKLQGCSFIKQDKYRCHNNASGVIDVDLLDTTFKNKSDVLPFSKSLLKNDMIKMFADLYEYSVYPTKEQIISKLNTLFPDSNTRTLTNLERLHIMENDPEIGWAYHLKNTVTRVTQEYLCSIIPGIYYNFVCRGLPKPAASAYPKFAANLIETLAEGAVNHNIEGVRFRTMPFGEKLSISKWLNTLDHDGLIRVADAIWDMGGDFMFPDESDDELRRILKAILEYRKEIKQRGLENVLLHRKKWIKEIENKKYPIPVFGGVRKQTRKIHKRKTRKIRNMKGY